MNPRGNTLLPRTSIGNVKVKTSITICADRRSENLAGSLESTTCTLVCLGGQCEVGLQYFDPINNSQILEEERYSTFLACAISVEK